MLEPNYFNTACCDPSLFNHSFSNLNLNNAGDVENALGLSSGDVTSFSLGNFNTLTPYDLVISDLNPISNVFSFKDYWGLLRNVNTLPGTIFNELTFFSNNVQTIGFKAFKQLEDSYLEFNFVDTIQEAGFGGMTTSEIKINNLKNLHIQAFDTLTNVTIKIGSNVKSVNWIGSTITPLLFSTPNNITIYMSLDLSLDPYMAANISAYAANVTLITY